MQSFITELYKCLLFLTCFTPLWYKLDDTKEYVGQFLEAQNLTNCFGRVHHDIIQLKCWRDNELVSIGLSHYI